MFCKNCICLSLPIKTFPYFLGLFTLDEFKVINEVYSSNWKKTRKHLCARACCYIILIFNCIMMSNIIFFLNVAGYAVSIKQKQTGSFRFPALLRVIITNALFVWMFSYYQNLQNQLSHPAKYHKINFSSSFHLRIIRNGASLTMMYSILF